MRKSILLLLMLLSALALTAGGAKESVENTITIWHSNSGRIGEAFETLIERFNDTVGKDSGIKAEAIYQGAANDVLTKVKATAAANVSELPDIAQMDATAALDMKGADYLVTTDELGADTSSILPSALKALDSDRGLLAMPFNCSFQHGTSYSFALKLFCFRVVHGLVHIQKCCNFSRFWAFMND